MGGAGIIAAVRRRAPPATEIIQVSGLRVAVTRKRVKNLNLRVTPPDGDVHLSVPYGTPRSAIDALVRGRLPWIARHRTRLRSLPRPASREYLSGESVCLLGQPRRLRFVPNGTVGALPSTVREDEIVLRVPLGATREVRARALDRWLRQEARRVFGLEVARWEPRLGVAVAQLGIKRMKTRWGTCNPTAKRVWLNLALLERPRHCLEYVVVHELAHLLVPHHGPAFWAVVERHLPHWREAKRELSRTPLWLDHPD